MEITSIDGKSLPELVSELRESFYYNEKARELFERKLMLYGYFDADVGKYEHQRYVLRKENFYVVDGGFPRVKKADLLLGVSDVRYTISLAVQPKNIITESCALKTILSYEGNK